MMQGMMKKERKRGSSVLEVDLLHGNILKSLLIFAIPLSASSKNPFFDRKPPKTE